MMFEALSVYLVPLMVGTRNIAFPRLNAYSYYLYVFGGIMFYIAFLCNADADNGEMPGLRGVLVGGIPKDRGEREESPKRAGSSTRSRSIRVRPCPKWVSLTRMRRVPLPSFRPIVNPD
jgi:hypothetical protein